MNLDLTPRASGLFPILAAICVAGAPAASSALTLAEQGTARVRVSLANLAIPSERTAAQELSKYLELVTTGRFPVIMENRTKNPGATIWVGPSAMSRRLGIDAESLGPEEWRIRTDGENLVLVGGRPRGTLYAVYRFLEDFIGVRWWTPYEETVPQDRNLTIGDIDAGGQPAFLYRDIHGTRGPFVFHAHNRANGHYSFLGVTHGGNEGYGPPFMVHTFFHYAPPGEYFEDHPEFYSEVNGERTAERSQLCLTNQDLLDLVEVELRKYIEQARVDAALGGDPAPRLFGFSHNDWGRPCTCEPCRALAEREGGQAGPLASFINQLAGRIAKDYPDVLLDTLAYTHTFQPPRNLRLRENVVVRLSALQYRDFLEPITDSRNRVFRNAIEGWRRKTDHLRIWGYAVTFGRRANNLPLPNLPVVAADFRYYLDNGVEGLFIQHDHPVLSDMRDLKLWVLLKLTEDPTRDLEALIADFTDGFYGPAAGTIREYLARLDRAARRKPAKIVFEVNYEQYRYLDPPFLRKAQACFDRAEKEVKGDPTLLARVRRARLSLDRATLLRWSPKLARPPRKPDQGPAIDSFAVAQRYHDTAYREIGIRIHPSRQRKHRERVDREISKTLSRIHE